MEERRAAMRPTILPTYLPTTHWFVLAHSEEMIRSRVKNRKQLRASTGRNERIP